MFHSFPSIMRKKSCSRGYLVLPGTRTHDVLTVPSVHYFFCSLFVMQLVINLWGQQFTRSEMPGQLSSEERLSKATESDFARVIGYCTDQNFSERDVLMTYPSVHFFFIVCNGTVYNPVGSSLYQIGSLASSVRKSARLLLGARARARVPQYWSRIPLMEIQTRSSGSSEVVESEEGNRLIVIFSISRQTTWSSYHSIGRNN